MIFKAYWRKLIARLMQATPGIGQPDEADEAVERSTEAIADAQRVHGIVVSNTDYLVDVGQRNHFREQVESVWTGHKIGRQPS